jgi:hypothetical protein
LADVVTETRVTVKIQGRRGSQFGQQIHLTATNPPFERKLAEIKLYKQ